MARNGFEVSIASSGEEALRVHRIFDPALVLLDLSGPGLSALDTFAPGTTVKPNTTSC